MATAQNTMVTKAHATPAVWVDAVWPSAGDRQSGGAGVIRPVLLALVGSALIAACAHIKVPMLPVPMTMQTFAVLAIGLLYGPRLAMATVLVYLAQGLAGLPVFTGGAGPLYMAGPTAGYLAGFVLAAGAVGALARAGWGRPVLRVFAAMLIGSALIYLCGWAWLTMLVGPQAAFLSGVVPFLLGDAVKAALAAALVPLAWQIADRTQG